MSYLKLMVGYNTIIPKSWINNTDTAFENLSIDDKSAFVLEQSVFVNFVEKLYNRRPPVLLKSYAKTIKGYAGEVDSIFNNTPSASIKFKENASWASQLLRGIVPQNVNDLITRLQEISSNGNFPHIADNTAVSFYRPFLTYFGTPDHSASVSEAVSIPTFALRGRFVFVSFTTKMIGYHFNETTKKALASGPYPIMPGDIFGFFSGYNWKDLNFSQLLGILSTYCFDLDSTNVPSDSYETIYKVLKSVITSYRSAISPYVDSLASSFDDSAIRRLFVSFLIDLRKLYGLKLDDAQTLAKVMGNDKQEDIENLRNYLEATKAADVSVEMFKAFRNSIFSDFEELLPENRFSKKKEKVTEYGKEVLDTVSMTSLKENLKALYRKDMRITDTAAFKDVRNVDESDTWSAEASDPFKLGKSPMDDANKKDDFKLDTKDTESGDVGATGDDDTTGTESDANQEASTTENGEQTPNTNPNDDTKQDNAHVPDLPDVSDKKGVKLELSSSESTDTVFYRLELKTYINSILANPPKYLSVQKIEALKKIKAFWINTLSPQCIHDVLSTIIRLPSMFKIHKHKR